MTYFFGWTVFFGWAVSFGWTGALVATVRLRSASIHGTNLHRIPRLLTSRCILARWCQTYFHKKTITRGLVALGGIILSACSQLQTTNSLPTNNHFLLNAWKISGKIGIKTTDDRISATLNWQQIDKHYDLSLSGPFGQGLTQISGDDTLLHLQTHNGRSIKDKPESVLQQNLGWSFPLDYFRYWAQGAIAPGVLANQVETNPQGLLTGFSQAGWNVRFSRHQPSPLLYRPLPAKVTAKREGMAITLLIKEWSSVASEKKLP